MLMRELYRNGTNNICIRYFSVQVINNNNTLYYTSIHEIRRISWGAGKCSDKTRRETLPLSPLSEILPISSRWCVGATFWYTIPKPTTTPRRSRPSVPKKKKKKRKKSITCTYITLLRCRDCHNISSDARQINLPPCENIRKVRRKQKERERERRWNSLLLQSIYENQKKKKIVLTDIENFDDY